MNEGSKVRERGNLEKACVEKVAWWCEGAGFSSVGNNSDNDNNNSNNDNDERSPSSIFCFYALLQTSVGDAIEGSVENAINFDLKSRTLETVRIKRIGVLVFPVIQERTTISNSNELHTNAIWTAD